MSTKRPNAGDHILCFCYMMGEKEAVWKKWHEHSGTLDGVQNVKEVLKRPPLEAIRFRYILVAYFDCTESRWQRMSKIMLRP